MLIFLHFAIVKGILEIVVLEKHVTSFEKYVVFDIIFTVSLGHTWCNFYQLLLNMSFKVSAAVLVVSSSVMWHCFTSQNWNLNFSFVSVTYVAAHFDHFGHHQAITCFWWHNTNTHCKLCTEICLSVDCWTVIQYTCLLYNYI